MSEILQALCCVEDTLRLHYRMNRYPCSCVREKKHSLLGTGVEYRPESLLSYVVSLRRSGLRLTPWHRQVWQDRSNRSPPKQSLTSGFEVSLKAPKQRLLHTSIGPGVRASFLVNVRPDSRAKQKRIKSRCNKKKTDLALSPLRATNKTTSRAVFSVSTPTIASLHEGRMVAVRGESRGIMSGFCCVFVGVRC